MTMNRTFGAPSRARNGSGQAGLEVSNVRPMTPGNAVPGGYSTSPSDVDFARADFPLPSDMVVSLLVRLA
jgi:hypothetical protein